MRSTEGRSKVHVLAVMGISIVSAIGMTLSSCNTMTDPDDENLTPKEYFQYAIEASDKDDYALALRFYEAFQEKHPEDMANNLWASYEIAFCYYKMNNHDRARELFEALLEEYGTIAENENGATVPQGPKILAEKVLEKLTPPEPKEKAMTTEEG